MDEFKFDNIIKGINLKNHIIKYDPKSESLLLYDLNCFLLDEKYIGFLINDICIIDDNYILIRIFYNILMKIKIINNTIEISDKLFINKLKIHDFIYIKESKFLIISFETIIGIWDIDSLHKNPIQIINNESRYLFNFNSNLFISYDHNKISFFKKTNNIILYQLSTVSTLNNNDENNKSNLIKLDKITLMIAQNNEIYLIDIRNMMTKKKFKFINGKGKINLLYKKDKDIYLNFGNYLYIFKYNKYNLEIIKTIKISELKYLKHENFDSKPNPILAFNEYKIFLNNNEPVKFSSFKHNYSIKFESVIEYIVHYMFDNFSDRQLIYLPQTHYADIKIERNLESKFSSLYKKEERSEMRKSKKNHIIIDKNNYNKRNKLKKMNIIKIRNNPKNFKNKFR